MLVMGNNYDNPGTGCRIFLVLFLNCILVSVTTAQQKLNCGGKQSTGKNYIKEIHAGKEKDTTFYEAEHARVYLDTILSKRYGYLFQNGFVTARWLFDWGCKEKCPLLGKYSGDFVFVNSIEQKNSSADTLTFFIKASCCAITTDYLEVFELRILKLDDAKSTLNFLCLKYLYGELQ